MADRAKAKALLGWEPEVDLDDGLRRTDRLDDRLPRLYKTSIYNV